MKKTTAFLFFVLFFFSLSVFAQRSVRIRVTGIARSVEQKMYYKDFIMHYPGFENVFFQVRNQGMHWWYNSAKMSYRPTYNPETHHYDINLSAEIKEDPRFFSMSKSIIIRVLVKTTFGNYVVAEEERTFENASEPMQVTRYVSLSENQMETYDPIKGFYIVVDGFEQSLIQKLSPSDPVQKYTIAHRDGPPENTLIQIKNKGEASWAVEERFFERALMDFNKRSFSAHIHKHMLANPNLDIYRPLIIRVTAFTEQKNRIWLEIERMIDNVHQPMRFMYYTKGLGANQTTNQSKITTTTTVTTTTTTTTSGTLPANVTTAIKGKTTARKNMTDAERAVAIKKILNPPILFKEQGGILKIAHVPTKERNPDMTLTSKLEETGTLKIDEQEIKLKKGGVIVYNPGKGYVIKAISDVDQAFKLRSGTIVIEGGSSIYFGKSYISRATVKEPVTLHIGDYEVPIKSGDIKLKARGYVETVFLAKEKTYKIGHINYVFGKDSKVTFSNGHFDRVSLTNSIKIRIKDKEYATKATHNSRQTSVWFNVYEKDVLRFRSTGGQSVTVFDAMLPIKEGSEVSLSTSQGEYVIQSVYLANDMELNLHRKNGRIKTKLVRAGQRVVIVDGKVRRVALF